LTKSKLRKIILARYYGFCMGVKRAIKIAEETGRTQNGPVNVVNEIVHNDSVVRELADSGVGTVSSVAEALGGTIIISAHGAPPSWFEEAEKKGLKVIDATCPLVIRIHRIIHKLVSNGYQIIHYGDIHHDETKGVVGQAPLGRVTVVCSIEELRALPVNGRKFALTSQTTAGVSDFERVSEEAEKMFPGIEVFNTICDATSLRQAAVMDLAPRVNLMLVVGSESSANSKRLRSISEAICGRAFLINSADSLDESRLEGVEKIGLTAGASTPDFLAEEVIGWLIDYSGGRAEVIRPEKDRRRKPHLKPCRNGG
jgi:4-hydroxy-3-methylbut-2-enyl diphosphate reductase